MKCKECRYFTGIQCHGHGDFWGSCNLINECVKELDLHCDYVCEGWDTICFDDTDCKIAKKFNLEECFFNKEEK